MRAEKIHKNMIIRHAPGRQVKAQILAGIILSDTFFQRAIICEGMPQGFHLHGDGIRLFRFDRLGCEDDSLWQAPVSV